MSKFTVNKGFEKGDLVIYHDHDDENQEIEYGIIKNN